MVETKFLKLISISKPILADGAMGTLLHDQGCDSNSCFDEMNLTKPDLVAGIHKAYIDAGSQVILTNTFGASHYKLERHGLISKIDEINSAGVSLARQVVASSAKRVLIGGDIGPLGVRIAPFGRVQPEEARNAFKEQIVFLLDEKVDLLVAETFSDLYEIREAIYAVRELSIDIPLVASMTFTRDDRTILGDSPVKVARSLRDFGADVIGVNCSGGPNQLIRILREMRGALPECKFWIKPNAGWPEQMGGRIFYPASADYFGDYAISFWKAGANVIGGCCGTTPAHIASMREVLDRTPTVEVNDIEISQERSEQETSESIEPTRLAKKLSKGKFVFAVEMDPPRGLSTHKLLASASLIEEAGADVIDVADSPMARMRMSPWAVCNLIQSRVKIETVLHFPTRGRNLLRVQGDLLAAHALDVRNVFVVMGDPTAIGDYPTAMDNYDLAPSGLIKMIKQGFNTGVDHAGSDIGQPTNFFVGTALNLVAPDMHRELTLIRRKIENGADFVLTQPIYTIKPLEDFLNLYEKEYGRFPLPIMAGILPLVSARHAAFLQQEVPGISIPDHMHDHMQEAGEKGAKKGIELAVKLIDEMKDLAQGVYLMPAFNRFDYAAEIIEKCK